MYLFKEVALKAVGQSLNFFNSTKIYCSKYSYIACHEACKYFYNMFYLCSDCCIKQVDEMNTVFNKKNVVYRAFSMKNVINIINNLFSREKQQLTMTTKLSDVLTNHHNCKNCFYKIHLINNRTFYTNNINLDVSNIEYTRKRNYLLCSIGNLNVTDFLQKFVNIEATPMTICTVLVLDSSKKQKNSILEMMKKYEIELEIVDKSLAINKWKSNDKLNI